MWWPLIQWKLAAVKWRPLLNWLPLIQWSPLMQTQYHWLNYLLSNDLFCRGRCPEWYNRVFGHMCANFLDRLRDSFRQEADGPETKVWYENPSDRQRGVFDHHGHCDSLRSGGKFLTSRCWQDLTSSLVWRVAASKGQLHITVSALSASPGAWHALAEGFDGCCLDPSKVASPRQSLQKQKGRNQQHNLTLVTLTTWLCSHGDKAADCGLTAFQQMCKMWNTAFYCSY